MSKDGVDTKRRRFLTWATSGVGAVGAGAWAWPFLASLSPSERAKALGAPVTVDLSRLEPGKLLEPIPAWRGRPVWVIRRTPEMLASLKEVREKLADPDSEEPQQPKYIQGDARSLKDEYLVMLGVCTHLGCSPKLRPEDTRNTDVGMDWKGGFYCPCHGSKFDLAGRVFAGVPAPTNIVVPPHRYVDDTTLVVGEDPEGVA